MLEAARDRARHTRKLTSGVLTTDNSVRYEGNFVCRKRERERRTEKRRGGRAFRDCGDGGGSRSAERGGGETPTKMMFGRVRREEVFTGNG